MIQHLVVASELVSGTDDRVYRPARLSEDGFVHCSDADITPTVANSYFSEAAEPVLVLDLDPERLGAEVIREAPAPIDGGGDAHREDGRTFPHVYGPIEREAVIAVTTLSRCSDGFGAGGRRRSLAESLAEESPSASAVTAFAAGARSAIHLLSAPDVALGWNEPSVLDGMSVGSLANHVSQAVSTAAAYLDATAAPEVPRRDAAGYFHAALVADDADRGAIEAAILDAAADAAAAGPEATLAEVERAWDAYSKVSGSLDAEALARRIEVFGPSALTVEDYLDTRSVELAVHLDDLHLSVWGCTGPIPTSTAARAVTVLSEVARRSNGSSETLAGLVRPERRTEPIRAF